MTAMVAFFSGWIAVIVSGSMIPFFFVRPRRLRWPTALASAPLIGVGYLVCLVCGYSVRSQLLGILMLVAWVFIGVPHYVALILGYRQRKP